MKQDVSNELLGAFVDGELDCADNRTIAEELKTNPELAARAQAMVDLKASLKNTYPETAPIIQQATKNKARFFRPALVASMMLSLGLIVGSSINSNRFQPLVAEDGSLYGIKLQPVALQDDKILLHISSAELDKLDFLLSRTERMLQDSRASGFDLNIEVIANSKGIDLLRKTVTPYEKRIIKLQQQYANLQFIACKNTIQRLKNSGQNVTMIQGVRADRPALDTIVDRMDKGWTYVKI